MSHTKNAASERPRVIVCLGNPGTQYAHTYHNAGYIALDLLRREIMPEVKTKSRPSFDYWKSPGFILVRPKTYMNDSGRAVAHALRFFHATREDLLVVHDDSDLPLGTARFATSSGAAGHNGVASIMAALDAQTFQRLRLGVRTQPGKAGNFVLHPMSPEEETMLAETIQGAIRKLTVNVTPSGDF